MDSQNRAMVKLISSALQAKNTHVLNRCCADIDHIELYRQNRLKYMMAVPRTLSYSFRCFERVFMCIVYIFINIFSASTVS